MLVYEIGRIFTKNTKIQVRNIVTDKLVWEGLAGDMENQIFNASGLTCVPDFIKPSYEYSDRLGQINFEIFFHYDNEYPQTILSQETIKRIYTWDIDSRVTGVVTGYNNLANAKKD